MSAINSIPALFSASGREIQESVGISQFPDEDSWYQYIGGMLFQGSRVAVDASTITTFNFVQTYGKKVLGIWLQTIGNGTLPSPAMRNDYVEVIDLATFSISNDYGIASSFYWWAIGY